MALRAKRNGMLPSQRLCVSVVKLLADRSTAQAVGIEA
jgi:hypothetical protein